MKIRANLEGLLVDVDIVANICLLGFAEEDEFFEEEDAPHTFLLPKENGELILPDQLALLLQIHLTGRSQNSYRHAATTHKVYCPHFGILHHSP